MQNNKKTANPITMTDCSNTNHNNSDRSSQWISCIARADFVGDANRAKLSFRKNDRLEVDLRVPPHIGWRWGKTDAGKGWFPEWAMKPIPSRTLPSRSEHKQQTSSSFQKHNNNNNNNNNNENNNNNHHLGRALGRSRNRVAPLAHISENPMSDMRMIQRPKQEKNNGFDLRSNDIMGGRNLPIASSNNHLDGQQTILLGSDKNNHGGMNWKEQFTAMMKNDNPYTQAQKEPEWDGSEVPQIVNNVNGRVTVLESNGVASSYQNERTYKLVDATNRMTEKLSSAGKTIENRASALRMPVLQKPWSNTNSSGSGNDSDKSTSSTTAKNHRKLPKMPSFTKKKVIGNMKFRRG